MDIYRKRRKAKTKKDKDARKELNSGRVVNRDKIGNLKLYL